MITFYQTIPKTIPLAEFEAWEEGKEWLDRAIACGAVDEVEEILTAFAKFEENGMVTDIKVNEELWFNEDIHELIEEYERRKKPRDRDKDSA